MEGSGKKKLQLISACNEQEGKQEICGGDGGNVTPRLRGPRQGLKVSG